MSLLPDQSPITVTSTSENETQEYGQKLAAEIFGQLDLVRPVSISLSGPLGAGKTAFARGFISEWRRKLNLIDQELVVSPTFNVARVYAQNTTMPIAHLDLYRLQTLEEAEALGFDHYANEHAVCLIEWLDQIPGLRTRLPQIAIEITFETNEAVATQRTLVFKRIFGQNRSESL